MLALRIAKWRNDHTARLQLRDQRLRKILQRRVDDDPIVRRLISPTLKSVRRECVGPHQARRAEPAARCDHKIVPTVERDRSEERRVGKEWRGRWSAQQANKT